MINATGASAFDDLVDVSVPWEDGTIVMLRAYFDASRRTSGIFCVAGVSFGIDRAKKADRRWKELFGDGRCHMTDLHAGRGAFEGITREEKDRYCRAAVQVINEYASHISVVSCDAAEVESLQPRTATPDATLLLDGNRSVYNSCLHWAMGAMGSLLGHADQQVQYWFEKGDEFQGAARRFLTEINAPGAESIRRFYCYGSDAFVSKSDACMFDAADIVAWEWGKHIERMRAGMPTRPSLVALMNDPCVVGERAYCRSANRYANHYTGLPLRNYFDKTKRVMAATSVEEIDLILADSSLPAAQSFS